MSSPTIQNRDIDDGETTTLLGNDPHNKYVPPGKIHLWWRNPIFYTSVLFSFFSFILLIIHATWIFNYGVFLSATSGFVFGICVIYYVTSRWNVRSYNKGLTGFEIFKFVLLLLVVLGAQTALIWYQATLLRIHVSAPDPDWKDFPYKCAENSQNLTILNCVRAGPGIPNPYTNKNSDPCLTVPTYNGSLSDVTAMFVEVIRSGLGCKVIAYNESIGFLHARCLTTFQGYPDDLALKFQCEAGVTMVWIHSQSRLGWWDFNFNDARVRLLLQYIDLWELSNLKAEFCRPYNGDPDSRKYVSLACKNCRDKHRRCDGKIPCTRCFNLKLECQYVHAKTRGGFKKKDDTKKDILPVTVPAQAHQPKIEPDSSPRYISDLMALASYYTEAYRQTSEYQFIPFSVPDPSALSSSFGDETKFRILSTLSFAALTVGHAEQGHILMQQVRKYVPEMMSSCTINAALGFTMLGSFHMMMFEFMPASNFLNLAKNISSSLIKAQRSNGYSNMVNYGGPFSQYALIQAQMIKISYYFSRIDFCTSVDKLKRSTAELWERAKKWQSRQNMSTALDVCRSIKVFYSILGGDCPDVLGAIEELEVITANTQGWMKSRLTLPMSLMRIMKYSLRGDKELALKESESLIEQFSQRKVFDYFSLSLLNMTGRMFLALGLAGELNKLVTLINQVVDSFPGMHFILDRLTNYDQTDEMWPLEYRWNPFLAYVAQMQPAEAKPVAAEPKFVNLAESSDVSDIFGMFGEGELPADQFPDLSLDFNAAHN